MEIPRGFTGQTDKILSEAASAAPRPGEAYAPLAALSQGIGRGGAIAAHLAGTIDEDQQKVTDANNDATLAMSIANHTADLQDKTANKMIEPADIATWRAGIEADTQGMDPRYKASLNLALARHEGELTVQAHEHNRQLSQQQAVTNIDTATAQALNTGDYATADLVYGIAKDSGFYTPAKLDAMSHDIQLSKASAGLQAVYSKGAQAGNSPENSIMIGSADAAEYIKTFDDPAMRASLEAQLDQTRANDKKAFQAQTEQQAVQVEQDFGALQQEVKTGYAGIPSIENAYKKGMLGDGVGAAKRRTQLLAAEATYQERHGAQQNLMSRVEQGLPVDAKDPKARRAVDDAVSAVDPNTGQPPTSEVMQDRAFNFAKSANVVAPLMQSQMRVGIASNDPQQLLWAAQSYRRLTREAPTADTGLDQRQQAVAEFASTLNEYGTPPAEIVRRVAMAAQKTDEERLRLKDQFDQQFNVPGAATSALNDQLKDAALHRSLMHPLTSSVDVTPEMTQEFRYLARENYARLGEDDPKYALGAAANMVISRYQPTTINGDATFLPFAAKWNQNEDANKKDLETTAKGGTFYQAAVNPTAQGDVHLAPVKIDDPKLITIRPIAAGFDPFKQYPENVRNGTIESQGNVWQILYDGIPLQHQDGLPVVWQPIEQTDAKLTDLTDQYNTQLSPAEEKKYQEWLKTRPEKQRNTYDYDLRGAFKADAQPSARGHLTDTYKKPNHPTFSTDSKYSGSGGNVGGQWKDLGHGNWSFTPSATNLKMHTKEQLQEYMKRNDPKVSLSFAR